MTPVENKRNDTKLLISVAALVVAGAAGIALIGGLALDDGAEGDTARAAPVVDPAPVSSEQAALPAVAGATIPETALASYETAEPEPVVDEPEAFTIDPNENFVARGLEAYASREFERSAAYFQAEIDARPQRSWTHYMHGLSLWKAGCVDEAAAAMEAAAAIDPDSVKTFVNLARIRNDQGDYEGALEAARTALVIDAEDPTALFLEGRSLFNLGRLDEAMESLTASAELAPDNGYVQNLLGLALIRQGRADEAVVALERAAALVSEVAYVQNNLGMALELSGRASEAVLAYRRSVEIDPTHAKAATNLARLEPAVEIAAAPTEPAFDEVAEAEADEPIEIAATGGEVNP
jgi:tetratricopeptide (TPR) repeat protein